jgi:AcrR family transcriptional regulator
VARRARKDGDEATGTRALLLDTTEKLMLDEGYAAVSTRRVAKLAGLTSALVHYYYPTTDDLLIAVYRRTLDYNRARLNDALAADRPLHALWAVNEDDSRMALALEFMALANHRKAIRAEIAGYAEYSRGLQSGALARVLKDQPADSPLSSPVTVSVLIAAISRLLVLEDRLGIASGHAEARAFIAYLLDRLEPDS